MGIKKGRALCWVAGLSALMLAGSVGMVTKLAQAKNRIPADEAAKTTLQAIRRDPDGVLLMQARALIGTLPDTMPGAENDTPAMVALGEKLYFEKAISINKTQSCNTCHPIDNNGAGADNRKTGLGAEGESGDINDPPTLNAGFQIAQFWDGRAATLEEQAQGPPLNPIEMGMPDAAAVEQRLKETGDYPALFKATFPDSEQAITFDNFAKAVAAFERTLISRARIDRFIAGEKAALSAKERDGMRTFMEVGCIQCHSGPTLGGMTFQKIGIFHEYANTKDMGRYAVTNNEADKYVFKVPMLRNATLTGPYFHDGEVANLGDAIDQMGLLQLDRELSDAQIQSLLRFMTALADEKLTTPADAKPASVEGDWQPPSLADVPEGEEGDLIRLGHALLTGTYSQLGPGAKDEAMRFSGNGLTCTNCHQDEGTKRFGVPWMGVSQAYPQYRGREDEEQGLEKRINGCFERSLNGKAIAEDSKEMKAMIAYMDWLSKDMSKETKGLGTPKFTPPERKADVEKGAVVYERLCLSCHGAEGDGYQSVAAGDKGDFVIPALWGDNSYNNGAGMNRILTNAPFIHANMPLGTPWDVPVLTVDEAYDIAGFLSSKERPQMSGLEKDYPKLEKKPVDCPYPPYTDSFTQEQHQYGPFQPIERAKKEQQQQATTGKEPAKTSN